MAIQHRRGVFNKFDPTRLLPGEWAVVLSGDADSPDGKAVYICFSAGDVKRMSTVEEIAGYIQAAVDAADRATEAAEAAEGIVLDAVPTMSETVKGGALLGDGLEVVDDVLGLEGESYTSAEKQKLAGIEANANDYTLPPATSSVIGGVKPDGTTITVAQDGTISGTETTPIATTSVAGKVKPDGTTVTVDQDGTIHGADTVPIATTSVAGKVKPDGTTITVDANGTISGATTYELPTMAANVKGGAKLGDGLSVSNDTLSADVTGVKGDAETDYRTGDVNITPANIGALDEDDYLAGLTWDQLAARFTWDDLAGGTSTDAHTDNLDLVKPSRLSTVAVNGNMDIIDAAVGAVDVETDGSLQEQVTALGESVYFSSPVTSMKAGTYEGDDILYIDLKNSSGNFFRLTFTKPNTVGVNKWVNGRWTSSW